MSPIRARPDRAHDVAVDDYLDSPAARDVDETMASRLRALARAAPDNDAPSPEAVHELRLALEVLRAGRATALPLRRVLTSARPGPRARAS